MRRLVPRWFSHLTAGALLSAAVPAGASDRGLSVNPTSAQNFKGDMKLPDSATAAIRNANEPIRMALNPTSGVHTARVTFYDPNQSSALEGGGRNRFSERINSIEDAAKNGFPVTVAADIYGSFGKECNQSSSRCLILITADGFNDQFPEYRLKFQNLPANSFIAIIEDTGGAFFGKGTKRLDLAARNARLARAIPRGFNDKVRWVQMDNPCGSGQAGRKCDFSKVTLAPTALAMLNLH